MPDWKMTDWNVTDWNKADSRLLSNMNIGCVAHITITTVCIGRLTSSLYSVYVNCI